MKQTFFMTGRCELTPLSENHPYEVLFFGNAQNTLSFFSYAQTQRTKKMKECFRQRSLEKFTKFEKHQYSLWFENFFTFVKHTK